MEDESNNLFSIDLSSSDESTPSSTQHSSKPPRDFQSEAAFQHVKASYEAKVENGELWRTLQLPIDNPSKVESQTLLHAIEELYFLKRYREAGNVTVRALGGKLMGEFRGTLEDYARRCRERMEEVEKLDGK